MKGCPSSTARLELQREAVQVEEVGREVEELEELEAAPVAQWMCRQCVLYCAAPTLYLLCTARENDVFLPRS